MVVEITDTHPKIEDMQLRLLRSTPVWRKLELMSQLNATAQILALSGLRARHPNAAEAELRRRLADLLLGKEVAAHIYGVLTEV